MQSGVQNIDVFETRHDGLPGFSGASSLCRASTYQNLSHSDSQCLGNCNSLHQLGMTKHIDIEGEDSDCSWTEEDDGGIFYTDVRQQLEGFARDKDRSTITTGLLPRHKRRFVHASAQFLHLGHASCGAPGKYRSMVIFKEDGYTFSEIDHFTGQEEQTGEDSSVSCLTETNPKKRRRLQRIDGGFPCQFEACNKIFDRASERTKHEQSHQSEFTHRFHCSQCDKGFRYPKDLRRHQKVHDKPIAAELDSANKLTPTSTLASESRVPSDTSLTFSAETVSKGNSPKMTPRFPNEDCDANFDPFVLDTDFWTFAETQIDHTFDSNTSKWTGFGFGKDDEFDEDFLEMARRSPLSRSKEALVVTR